MSGPGGLSTKRDQRRDTRRSQLQQRQLERQRERERRIRQQRIQRGAIIGGSVLLTALLAFFVVHAVVGGSSNPTPAHAMGTYTSPADGSTRDGLTCLTQEGLAQHFHVYLAIYANGKQVQVTPNAGIVSNTCLYALHVHDGEANIVHIESPTQSTFTLGQFFDIWGEPLSATQVMSYKADATHTLVYKVFDAKGALVAVTGNPVNIKLAPHETIYALYNSPNVKPVPFTGWKPNE